MATQVDGAYELQPTSTDERSQYLNDCPEGSTLDSEAVGTIEHLGHGCCHYPLDLARSHPYVFILWLVLLSMAMALVVLAVIFGIKNPRPDFMNKQGHYVPTEHYAGRILPRIMKD